MSIGVATLSDLKGMIQNRLKRAQFFDPLGNDVTQDALWGFVNFGLQSIQRMLVVRDAEHTTTVTIGPSNHPFPIANFVPSYRYMNDLWLQGTMAPLYRYRTVREFHEDYPPSMAAAAGSVTRGYCVYDGMLNLGPAPMEDWTYYADYVAWLPWLSNPDDTNWYTMNASDAVIMFACRQAALWLMEDQLYQFYDQLGQKALDEVRKTIRNEETAEGQIQGRLFGAYRSTSGGMSRALRRRDVYP